ncbi:MAG: UDP-N-acetylmuramoyl-tripeptide--D-alanyl-D-alanine ligase [Dehalococcoidia bacterium]
MRDVWEGTGQVLVASRCDPSVTFAGPAIDSRSVQPGDLFFALHGENQDGHDFVGDAVARGAASGAAVFHTCDSLTALHRIATRHRNRHDVRVVGVTGSVGKTTCKEIVASVLSRSCRVLKSEANYNTDIGIALTLLQLTPEHERAVLELAMYGRGEIALLAEMASPHVGIVTNIGPVHLERVGWMGGIVEAKGELIEALPNDGLAVLNGDDARTAALAHRTGARVVFVGESEQCTVRGRDIESHGLDGISFRMEVNGESVDVSCPLPGRHHVFPALAATAVALNEGMSLQEIADALADVRLEQRLSVTPGPNGSTIIDDSYNASPAAMLAALDLLSELDGRRIAILGDMLELGTAEEEGHRAVGRHAAECCDVLFVIGDNASITSSAAREAGHPDVRILESSDDAAEELRMELRGGDYALIKASRALGLEKLVEALVAQ